MPSVNTRVFFSKIGNVEFISHRCGSDMSFCKNLREYDEVAPWSHINMLVSREFFINENKKAREGVTTPNCREQCSNCGVIKNVGGDICCAIR